MYDHAPENYTCPICLAIQGIESDQTMMKQKDIFYRDDLVLGIIGSKQAKNNPGHPLVVPIEHYENIYDVPRELVHRIMEVGQRVALALKEVRKCDGVTFVQNNEPAGDQHAFHYHLHVFPRFEGDELLTHLPYTEVSDPSSRILFADQLRSYFQKSS